MFKKILVPLDGSPLAEYALTPAFDLAMQNESELIFLNVVEVRPIAVPEPTMGVHYIESRIAEAREEAMAYLTHVINRSKLPTIKPRTMLMTGNAADVILATAAAEDVDLIIMSTHGRSGFERWMMGSVTERVLRNAACPVFVVRNPTPIKRVLVPVDGSPLAETAVEPALDVASLFGADVTFFTAEAPVLEYAGEFDELNRLESGLGDIARTSYYNKSEEYIQGLTVTSGSKHDLTINYAMRTGYPADAILNYADTKDTDLIVMATHGHTGLRRWVYGSVAEKVLRGAHCNLLVIRPNQELFDN